MLASQQQKRRIKNPEDKAWLNLSCYSDMPSFGQPNRYLLGKEVGKMRKSFVVFMTTGITLAGSGIALANIVPITYSSGITQNKFVESKSWTDVLVGKTYICKSYSTYPYGTWNSSFILGVDNYNNNESHDYISDVSQINIGGEMRSNTRLEACDWCHGTGASSGLNIQLNNDIDYFTGHETGHTMDYGNKNSGFACLDCHIPFTNPARVLDYNNDGNGEGQEIGDTISLSPVYNGQYASQALLCKH